MPHLSDQLYDLANAQADEDLNNHKQQCFLWIWYWLLINQPSDVLEQQLQEIEAAVDTPNISAAQVLEFAWKAQAVETLLS